MPDEMAQQTESEIEPQSEPETESITQHYSALGIKSAEQEESYQAAELDAFFSDTEGETESEISTYTLTDSTPVLEQLVITNGLLTYILAVNIVLYILIIAYFVIGFLRSLITKIF